ncbi:unnamed protein product [Orchesella dallaii]|uniref:Short-chain dehydrogenase TIC 32, chloroplastic n=1 Tax=Orchesella dallaii TaxID=48710 RepID=A0ABP1RRM5_9HEXA
MMAFSSDTVPQPQNPSKRRGSSDLPCGNFFRRCFKQLWLFTYMVYILTLDIIEHIFIKAPKIEIEELEKRSEQVAVMTGGPRGIGNDIVKKLLQLDYTVILGVRNESTSQKGIDKIRDLGVTTGRVKFFYLDLKSLESVREFANKVLDSKEGSRIDLLLNNAGIFAEGYEKTGDNFESTFQVNYLSHFLLTNLLLPRIKETATKNGAGDPCHIVSTSSCLHRCGTIDFEELETSKVYSPLECYCLSKLCQIIHVKMLDKKFQEEKMNIHAYAVHPGVIVTGLWDDMGGFKCFKRPFNAVMKWIGRTSDEGANTILYPLLTPDLLDKAGGHYFETGNVVRPDNQANQPEVQQSLWKGSLKLTTSIC